MGEVAKLFVDAGIVVLAAFISPYQEDRERVRALFGAGEFAEIYVRCDLETCERRDPKGLYRKSRAGQLSGFTGIDSPYEEPVNPELIIGAAASFCASGFFQREGGYHVWPPSFSVSDST